MMTNPPRDSHDDNFSSKSSADHQKTDLSYTERSLTAVYEGTEESNESHPGARPQEVEPTSALMRRYHR